jgi:tRNA(fMet)-specific endonuclease VapC
VIRYLIDANAAVYAMDVGNEGLKARLADCEAGSVALSTISYAEVAYGTHVGKPPPPEVLEAFIQAIPLLPFDEAAAREYAKLPFKRARFDRLLAAHALSIGAIVVTNNEADFADVAELVVENWTE